LTDFIKVLTSREIKISMDGKGAWRDNVFVERLWRTIKYEEVYLRAYASVSEARAGIGRYLGFYNSRPHIHRLTVKRPIRPTSTSRCPKRPRLNRGGNPLRKRLEPVQSNRTTSHPRLAGTMPSPVKRLGKIHHQRRGLGHHRPHSTHHPPSLKDMKGLG
jgi:hypothetical protein